jgi:hypothetical protein
LFKKALEIVWLEKLWVGLKSGLNTIGRRETTVNTLLKVRMLGVKEAILKAAFNMGMSGSREGCR